MANLSVYHDPDGRTLTVWFEDPRTEHTCEETGDEIVLMKDREGHVIGFEKLNYPGTKKEAVKISYEQLAEA